MEHDGSAVSVFDEHADEGHADENIVGVIVLHMKEYKSVILKGRMSGTVSSAYFCGKGLLAKAVQLLHLLDVQQLCFSRLHSTGEQRSTFTKPSRASSCSTKLQVPVALVLLRDLLGPLLQHFVTSWPVLAQRRRMRRVAGRKKASSCSRESQTCS